MTKEYAIYILNTLQIGANAGARPIIPQYELAQALSIAIKALEQESVLDKAKAEIKEWYWQADKQALAKDPCVVDAMIDLFIRTINKYKTESEE